MVASNSALMRAILVTAILLAGCNANKPESLDRLYADTQADLLAADSSRAALRAERGLTLARERHDAQFEGRFRLARAEALLFTNRPEPALAELRELTPGLPASSAF